MIIAYRHINDNITIVQKEEGNDIAVFILSKNELKYILICSSISSIGIMSYLVLRIMKLIGGVNFTYIYFTSDNFIFVLWYTTFFAILILLYFNIKILRQIEEKKLKSKLRIFLYITVFYLIAYVPATSYIFDNIEWIFIEIFGCIFFFFFSFYIRKYTALKQ
jgi:hypothetical protein